MKDLMKWITHGVVWGGKCQGGGESKYRRCKAEKAWGTQESSKLGWLEESRIKRGN